VRALISARIPYAGTPVEYTAMTIRLLRKFDFSSSKKKMGLIPDEHG